MLGLLQVVEDTEEDEMEACFFVDLWLQKLLAAKYLASLLHQGKVRLRVLWLNKSNTIFKIKP